MLIKLLSFFQKIGISLLLVSRFCVPSLSAQQNLLPQLPSEPFDYETYAVTNLPEYYLPSGPFSDAAAANNTPADNPITNEGATLGRVLFYDTRLSIDHSISCASCHTQATGFGDQRRFSVGHDGSLTPRHSMSLSNAKFYFSGRFRWDESAATLEDQCLIPIDAPDEMGLPLPTLRKRLADTDFYPALFSAAFGSDEVTDDRIARAMAQFIRSMVTYNSKYDAAFDAGEFGFPNFPAVFSESENLGRRLFERTELTVNCHRCHETPAQIAEEPRNIGLDLKITDPGAGEGRFKSMSLRNVAVRGRFMHDGRFNSLSEVVEFYDTGVQDSPFVDPLMTFPLNLSQVERDALVDFLETLTDDRFLNDPKFSDPFDKPTVLLGDVDLDGSVTMSDISAFVDRLVEDDYQFEADMNLDGTVNLRDIPRFVRALNSR